MVGLMYLQLVYCNGTWDIVDHIEAMDWRLN